MNARQRQIIIAIDLFAATFLLWFITQVTNAYIGMAYPEVPQTQVASLITLPNLFGLIVSFLIGPLTLKFNKVKLSYLALVSIVIYCAMFYIVGRFHLPFYLLSVACFFAGFSQGAYVPLLNSIITDHFPSQDRDKRIANYNVWISVGTLIILQVAGIIAAGNDGADWYNAYLLGVIPIVSMVIYIIMMKKAKAEVPSIVPEDTGADKPKARISDIPRKAIGWIILMGLVHCIFYLAQYAFNTNVSSYIITEYELGTSAQAGTATSLYRVGLIVFTSLYPVFKKLLKNLMIPVGYITMGVGLVIMMVSKSLFGAYACGLIAGLATALCHSTLYAKASNYVPLALVPVAMSLVWGIANIGTSVAVQVLGFVANFFGGGMENSFLACIIMSVVACVAAVYMYVIKKPVQQVD